MTNQEILTKAIQKAIEGGWKQPDSLQFTDHSEYVIYNVNGLDDAWSVFKIRELLLNREFAKALWGEAPEECGCDCDGGPDYFDREEMPAWQYHLQQLVISEDPIKYLGENL